MKKFGNLGRSLSREEQCKVNGGLPDGCHCIFVSEAAPCSRIYWDKPCGVQQGQYVICDSVCPEA